MNKLDISLFCVIFKRSTERNKLLRMNINIEYFAINNYEYRLIANRLPEPYMSYRSSYTENLLTAECMLVIQMWINSPI